ncbi:S26 family signal peptidase [Nocardioides marmorisolisilvae]|uniref:S26 family signal peptidase n=1 Tax=Nocardioides marmorisolisilvae TaxID=1542737 RepID=A0A3N0DU83_9ACTN|nr:S26 family signal peptidase [Nocardioides marmorisolisilvae]RNL79189.1 S26 family signal peptidase [Nocardioides marmorisolisilvae]
MTRRIAAWAGVAFLVAFIVVLAGWRAEGGRWVRVETPSMGTRAPVGTLLWVKPVTFSSLKPGDLITFTPPGGHGVTYSHEVKKVFPDGTLATQGRITAQDPWRLGPQNVVGKTVMRWPGAGWLVLAAPVLVLGSLVVAGVAGRVREREARMPVLLVGGALVIVTALVVYRPLTQADRLSFVPVGSGAKATYVSTGMLPVKLSAKGSEPVVLADGEVGSIVAKHATGVEAGKQFTVSVQPAIPMGWWIALVAACFVPGVASTLRRRTNLPS